MQARLCNPTFKQVPFRGKRGAFGRGPVLPLDNYENISNTVIINPDARIGSPGICVRTDTD